MGRTMGLLGGITTLRAHVLKKTAGTGFCAIQVRQAFIVWKIKKYIMLLLPNERSYLSLAKVIPAKSDGEIMNPSVDAGAAESVMEVKVTKRKKKVCKKCHCSPHVCIRYA